MTGLHNAIQGSKANSELRTKSVLPVKSVLGSEFLHGTPSHASNAGPAEHRQRIVGAENQPVMQLWMPPQPKQHTHAIGEAEGRDVRVKIGVSPSQVEKRLVELFIKNQTVAATVRRDDRYALIQRYPQFVRIACRLVRADQAEFIAHMAQQRNPKTRQFPVERNITPVRGIELLRIRQPLHEFGPALSAALEFFHCARPLRIHRDASPKVIGMQLGQVKNVIVRDQNSVACGSNFPRAS